MHKVDALDGTAADAHRRSPPPATIDRGHPDAAPAALPNPTSDTPTPTADHLHRERSTVGTQTLHSACRAPPERPPERPPKCPADAEQVIPAPPEAARVLRAGRRESSPRGSARRGGRSARAAGSGPRRPRSLRPPTHPPALLAGSPARRCGSGPSPGSVIR